MTDRGIIRNRDFATQIRDFSGLRFGKITPTDIDAFMDFGNKLFVFVESKHGSATLPYGQELALARLVDACHKPPERYAICIVSRHDEPGDIDFAGARITKYRWDGRWTYEFRGNVTVRFAVESMVKRFVERAK